MIERVIPTSPAAPATASSDDTVARTPAILLVDDHDLFRAGLRSLLATHQVRVVGDSRCDPTAVGMATRTRASVVVIDSNTTDERSTAPLVRAFLDAIPEIGVIVFTRSVERPDIYAAIRAGARGYVGKSQPIDRLVEAIEEVHAGNAWFQPETLRTTLEFIRTGEVPMVGAHTLSERELDVVRLVADGLENSEIGEILGLSAKTVKNHVSNILAKLGVANRVHLAVFAVRSGIV